MEKLLLSVMSKLKNKDILIKMSDEQITETFRRYLHKKIQVTNLQDYHRGWIIGDYEPAVLKTDQFEVGILNHTKGEEWPAHYHEHCDEYNVLLKGEMQINGRTIYENQIFFIPKNILSVPTFIKDCVILCIKTPSVPGDKVVV
jgi:mannose-6-phosphate isomerase-like protein (cupin superfamily)